jgi:hypothetical protein
VLPPLLIVAALASVIGTLHLWLLWRDTQQWLDTLARLPLRKAFKRIHATVIRLVGKGTRMRACTASPCAELERLKEAALRSAAIPDGPTALRDLKVAVEAYWNGAAASKETVKAVEDYLALRFALQIGFFVARLRTIWIGVTVCALLFVTAISTCPVHPHKQVLALSWLIVGAVVAVTVPLFVKMNRNEVLSLLAGNPPNEVTWDADFVEKLIWFAAVPLIGLAAAQFPEVAQLISKLLDPVLRGAH